MTLINDLARAAAVARTPQMTSSAAAEILCRVHNNQALPIKVYRNHYTVRIVRRSQTIPSV